MGYMFLTKIVVLLGLAYLLWIEAVREKGALKIIGQVLAVLVLILAVTSAGYRGLGGHGSMMNMPADHQQMMQKMMEGGKK